MTDRITRQNDMLSEVREARQAHLAASHTYLEAVQHALKHGAKATDVAEAAGVSRQEVYRLGRRNTK